MIFDFFKDVMKKIDKEKIKQSSAVNVEGYVLDAREKNPSISGTMANQISELNTNLTNATTYVTESVNWSSTTIFMQYGIQRLFKVGNVCDLHLFFHVNSPIVNGAVICGLPRGFAPNGSIVNYATRAVNPDGKSTILPVDIANNGQITTRSAFNGGDIELNIRYVVKN